MPCDDPLHEHIWPSEGTLTLQHCEHYCGYCIGPAREHYWRYPWFLRRHIRTVHVKDSDRPNVTVAPAISSKSVGSGRSPRKTPRGETRASTKSAIRVPGANRVIKSSARGRGTPAPSNIAVSESLALMAVDGGSKQVLSPSDDSACALDKSTDSDIESNEQRCIIQIDSQIGDLAHTQVPVTHETQLKMAFKAAVKDLIQQGVAGGLAVLDVAIIIADEADRAAIDPSEGAAQLIPQMEHTPT